MKTIQLSACLLAAAFFLLSAQPAFCQQSTDAYGALLDREMMKCEQKLIFISSKSANLRNDGKWASFKLRFLRDYRDNLIANMKREKIEPKDYIVSQYLTEQFLEVYSPLVAGEQKQANLSPAR